MKFTIVPAGDGFSVIWCGGCGVGEFTIAEVEGFATHEAAQVFVQDVIIKMARAFQRAN